MLKQPDKQEDASRMPFDWTLQVPGRWYPGDAQAYDHLLPPEVDVRQFVQDIDF